MGIAASLHWAWVKADLMDRSMGNEGRRTKKHKDRKRKPEVNKNNKQHKKQEQKKTNVSKQARNEKKEMVRSTMLIRLRMKSNKWNEKDASRWMDNRWWVGHWVVRTQRAKRREKTRFFISQPANTPIHPSLLSDNRWRKWLLCRSASFLFSLCCSSCVDYVEREK